MMTKQEAIAYYTGFWESMLYRQADVDVKGYVGRPTVIQRLPREVGIEAEPFDLALFREAIDDLDADGGIVYWNIIGLSEFGEYTIEVGSSEGHQGVPEDWPERENHEGAPQ